jgi:type IV secretory pathway TraG/TraD family ATPase VirD4
MPEHLDDAWVATLPLADTDMELLVPPLMSQAGFDGHEPQRIGMATATRRERQQHGFRSSREYRLVLKWRPCLPHKNVTLLAWAVEVSQGVFKGDVAGHVMHNIFKHLHGAVSTVKGWQEAHPVRRDPVLGPDEVLDGPWEGTLRDYSGCATSTEVLSSIEVCSPQGANLDDGVLPLGRYTFGFPPHTAHGPMLYMGRRSANPRERMEYRGTLVCAPPGAGKTELIVRWAVSAMLNGYSTLIVDVKGDMKSRLEQRFRQLGQQPACKVYHFSTDPTNTTSHRINFLEGLSGSTPDGRTQLRQLATAILPEPKGFESAEQRQYYEIRVRWLTAMLGLVKLHEAYRPYTQRQRDLSDVYRIASSEAAMVQAIVDVAADEEERLAVRLAPLEPGLDWWFNDLNILLPAGQNYRPEGSPLPPLIGQRIARDSFSYLTFNTVTALTAFSPKGALYDKIIGRPREGRSERVWFDIRDLFKPEPITVILEARTYDQKDADAVISMVIAHVQLLLEQRHVLEDPTPVLLLLDETTRIRGFDPHKYIEQERSAKVAVVLVYQQLNQIADGQQDEAKIGRLLETVGTQIYLDSIAGNTHKYFSSQLPERHRPKYVKLRGQYSAGADMQISTESVETLERSALFQLPAGKYPALVFMREHPCGKPFLVDMDEQHIEIRRRRLRLPPAAARALAQRSALHGGAPL